jgi:hypothetical protein
MGLDFFGVFFVLDFVFIILVFCQNSRRLNRVICRVRIAQSGGRGLARFGWFLQREDPLRA